MLTMTPTDLIIANFGKYTFIVLCIAGFGLFAWMCFENWLIGRGLDRDRDENR